MVAPCDPLPVLSGQELAFPAPLMFAVIVAAVHDGGVATDPAEVFLAERTRLFRLAYGLLGSASDAEDAVQGAFEKWIGVDSQADGNGVAAPAA